MMSRRTAMPADLEADAAAASAALGDGAERLAGLAERERRRALVRELDEVRERFLRRHAEQLYFECADGGPLRVEQLLERAAERVPGLVPTPAEVAAEREHLQGEKDGLEIAHGPGAPPSSHPAGYPGRRA